MDHEKRHLPQVKLRKVLDEDPQSDVYCFECHQAEEVLECGSCPRVYHPQCLGLNSLSQSNWTCPECEAIQSSLPTANPCYSIKQLRTMLRYILERLKSQTQSDYFLRSVDVKQYPDYYDYIIHPMDLETIEKNVNQKKYSSTDAFLCDIRWILHNTSVYNGIQHRLTQIARSLLKLTRHEIAEIEICPDCYVRSTQSSTADWFTKPCSIPHTLCWAKMKSYQPWPAKVLRILNDEVDVRFFGKHDRAKVPYNNCFVLSKEYPGTEKKKINVTLERSMNELEDHIEQLKGIHGEFHYASPHTLLNRLIPFQFVAAIDDSMLPSYMTNAKQRRQMSSVKTTAKRSSEQSEDPTAKRPRNSSIYLDEEELQSSFNVFDILNQPDQIRSISPTDNKYRIQALIRKYVQFPSLLSSSSSSTETVDPEVRSTVDALLDAVEALKPPKRTKRSRKSNLQHRIPPQPNLLSSPSLDQFLCPTLSFVPLRPLSVSPPPSIETFESLPQDEIFSELMIQCKEEPEILAESSITIETPSTLPTIIPSIPDAPQTNIWPSVLSIDKPKRKSKSTKSKRSTPFRRPSPQNIAFDEQPVRDNIQTIVDHFQNQFQQLLVNFTDQIDASLHTTRMKYEKDLEDLRRSYRLSLTELQSITTEQVQEIHNSLELQYWKRLSEMRNRYESKLHYSLPSN